MVRKLVTIGALLSATLPLIAQTGAKNGEWRSYAAEPGSTKYSPLDQITADNFGTLRLAWRAKSPDHLLSLTLPGGGELVATSRTIFDQLKVLDPRRWRDNESPYVGNFKATPLMVGGRLYLNSPTSVGAALDARLQADRGAQRGLQGQHPPHRPAHRRTADLHQSPEG